MACKHGEPVYKCRECLREWTPESHLDALQDATGPTSGKLVRRLTTDERGVMRRALRRSVKVVAKGKPVTD